MDEDAVRRLPVVVDLVRAAAALGIGIGIGRTLAYEMVRTGRWPTQVCVWVIASGSPARPFATCSAYPQLCRTPPRRPQAGGRT